MTDEIQIRVFGDVQGVGFRFFVRQLAKRLDVAGFVENRPDGSVMVVGQGKKAVLDLFLTQLRVGNSFCRIDRIETDWRKEAKKRSDFEIRR